MVPNHQPVWVYMGSSSYKSLNIIHQPTITNHCQPLLTITQHTWLLPHMYRKQCFFWWPTLWVAVPGRVRHVHPNPRASWPGTTACGQTTLHKLHWVHLSGSHTCDDTGGWSQKKTAKLKQRRFVSLQLSVSLDATMFRSLDSDWCQNWRRRNS